MRGFLITVLFGLVVLAIVLISSTGKVSAQGVSLGFPNEHIATLAMAGNMQKPKQN